AQPDRLDAGGGMTSELEATEFLDHTSPEVAEFVAGVPGDDGLERAVALYRAVRDRIRYEVYGADLSRKGLRASTVLRGGSGMCLLKSVVFVLSLLVVVVPV